VQGLAVFFIRRAVFASGVEAEMSRIIDSCGFEVLKAIDLEDGEIDAATRITRGADWGPDGFTVDGGPPVRLLIAFDVKPTPVTEVQRQKYPHLDNGHILDAQLRCREVIAESMPPDREFDPIHTTVTSAQALDVVRMIVPDEEPSLRETIKDREAAFATRFEVVRDLTRTGLRSKIEQIRYGGGLAVKKTFRHNCLRFLEREYSFMEDVSPHRREIPPVLELGTNYLIMPFLEGQTMRRFVFGRGIPRLMTLRQVRQVADLLRFLFSRGYDPVDFGPHNMLVDRSGSIRAIDFEFVHRAAEPVEPEQSACLSGMSVKFKGEWPPDALWCPRLAKCMDPWRLRWYGCTGLTLQSFLYDPPALQWVKRIVNYPAYLGKKVVERRFLSPAQVAKQS
jgi:hypothetical protein